MSSLSFIQLVLRDLVGPTCFGSASAVVRVTSCIVLVAAGLSKLLVPGVGDSAACLPGGQTGTVSSAAQNGGVSSLWYPQMQSRACGVLRLTLGG